MTVQEMYQEMMEQSLEDLLLGYNDPEDYNDRCDVVEIEYTTQS